MKRLLFVLLCACHGQIQADAPGAVQQGSGCDWEVIGDCVPVEDVLEKDPIVAAVADATSLFSVAGAAITEDEWHAIHDAVQTSALDEVYWNWVLNRMFLGLPKYWPGGAPFTARFDYPLPLTADVPSPPETAADWPDTDPYGVADFITIPAYLVPSDARDAIALHVTKKHAVDVSVAQIVHLQQHGTIGYSVGYEMPGQTFVSAIFSVTGTLLKEVQ